MKAKLVRESLYNQYDEIMSALLRMGYNEVEADFILGEVDSMDLPMGDPDEIAQMLAQEVMGSLKD